ncbi:Nickel uptake substrate-specific transmembrane region [Bremerella volcania]|uniref:Nickel uptake substrate-specific transmembrane region n=1 Tax=Bremerella volcania TaxID=2527984 RepID=A0A518C4V2_9BACT|nr:hypothetical protein [Bremerella volcania]QDU74260.1 Nickel uptake substrate-specific transmembrane region [Bremerella volcania]
MRWCVFLLLILVTASTAWAAPGDDAPESTKRPEPLKVPIPKAPIGRFGDGIVYDLDGTPVEGAEVLGYWEYKKHSGMSAYPIETWETKTDANGRFSCNPPKHLGDVTIHVLVRDGKGNYASETIHKDGDTQPIKKLVLLEEKYHQVCVIDEDGKPQAGITVFVACPLGPRLAATTDGNGRAYVLSVKLIDTLVARMPGKLAGVQVFGNRATRRSDKINVVTPIEVKRVLPREVVVRSPDGKPLSEAFVAVRAFSVTGYDPLDQSYFTATDAQGRATIDLPILTGGVIKIFKDGYYPQRVEFGKPDWVARKIPVFKEVTLPELVTLRGVVDVDPSVKLDDDESSEIMIDYLGTNPLLGEVYDKLKIEKPGSFELRLPADSQLVLNAYQQQHYSRVNLRVVRRGEEAESVKLKIQSPVTITGIVLDKNTRQPLANHRIIVSEKRCDPQVQEAYFQQHAIPNNDMPRSDYLRDEGWTSLDSDEHGKFQFNAYSGYITFRASGSDEYILVRFKPGDTPTVTLWADGEEE